mmetsp:Transcript_24462/g.70771  ORF Transcript_24462/g.70771 Transcript_24462/m.70771 type:complete len:216 (+) Transcript_24462:758-1405(+)
MRLVRDRMDASHGNTATSGAEPPSNGPGEAHETRRDVAILGASRVELEDHHLLHFVGQAFQEASRRDIDAQFLCPHRADEPEQPAPDVAVLGARGVETVEDDAQNFLRQTLHELRLWHCQPQLVRELNHGVGTTSPSAGAAGGHGTATTAAAATTSAAAAKSATTHADVAHASYAQAPEAAAAAAAAAASAATSAAASKATPAAASTATAATTCA